MAATPGKPRLFNSRSIGLIAVLVIVLGIWLARARIPFDWHSLGVQLRSVSPFDIVLAIAIVYVCYVLRAARWAVLISPLCTTSTLQMTAPQFIGFALVGMFGRVADLARPYLIARRTRTTVASQLAVYSIERAFDLGAAAILFSITLAFAPRDMPHHEAFARAGAVSLAATAFLVVFAFALRLAGGRVAEVAARLLAPVSAKLSASAATHILSFSEGLRIVSTLGEFLAALALSLVMWLGIALGYLVTAHAFRASAELAGFSFAATMLQLPVLGWFTQIALLAAALHGFFGVPLETASACGAVLLFVMSLAVIPAGLIAARMEGISLLEAAQPQAEVGSRK
jgi:uncharacterized membrane protein YbhN (UPF0104 family)